MWLVGRLRTAEGISLVWLPSKEVVVTKERAEGHRAKANGAVLKEMPTSLKEQGVEHGY